MPGTKLHGTCLVCGQPITCSYLLFGPLLATQQRESPSSWRCTFCEVEDRRRAAGGNPLLHLEHCIVHGSLLREIEDILPAFPPNTAISWPWWGEHLVTELLVSGAGRAGLSPTMTWDLALEGCPEDVQIEVRTNLQLFGRIRQPNLARVYRSLGLIPTQIPTPAAAPEARVIPPNRRCMCNTCRGRG